MTCGPIPVRVIGAPPEAQQAIVLPTLVGPPGPAGEPGQAGPTGAGLHITGALPDVSALPASAATGDAYLIAGNLHVWIAGAWVNAGPIQGPPGPPGHPGQIRFTGHGAPPMVIVGAEPGDTYLDLDTGNVFKLT